MVIDPEHVRKAKDDLSAMSRRELWSELKPARDQFGDKYVNRVLDMAEGKTPAAPVAPKTPIPDLVSKTVLAPNEVGTEDEAALAAIAAMDAEFHELGLDDTSIEAMERWIMLRVGTKVLAKLNEAFLKLRRRKLDYHDLAVIALIHRRSVLDQDGRSPYTRFTSYSELKGGEFASPVFNGHVARVLGLLQGIGFTKLVEECDRGKKLAAKYTVIAMPELEAE